MANHVKILLVDDNPMVLGLLQEALTPLANVTTSNDSADALLKAVDDPPDLLVSDYRMPGMDGQQLVEKLKSRPKTAGISVILLASKADITERFRREAFFSQRSYPTYKAPDRQNCFGKNGQDCAFRWCSARQPGTDECD